MSDILYHIKPADLAGHLFAVELHIRRPDPRGQIVSLPTWIPGSYLIRDFSRHIQQLRASSGNKPLTLTKLDNHSWQIQASTKPIKLSYLVYAWDLSVRAAHLDETHGFFNGTSVFLKVHKQENHPCYVDIQAPDNYSTWKVYTSLPEAIGKKGAAKRHGFGLYKAPNYDALVDHPVEMGTPAFISFEACGARHEMVFTGLIPNIDLERIARDTAKICEYQIKLFEPKTHKAPFLDSSDRYVFMTMVTGSDYGGLEHRASTALMASRSDIPVIGQTEMTDGYCQFLGLISHEYFHTWNVKRIKPQTFAPYDLTQATPTSLLWIFEGFTSYYDDQVLYRTGLITEEKYLSLIEKTLNNVCNAPGRFKQSVADSSFDAWNKYYKQDENSPNAIVSYYTKGSLVALGLDLLIQQKSSGKKSLDDVMRLFWKKFGRDFYTKHPHRGLRDEQVISLIKEATGVDTAEFVERYALGVEDVPLAKLWASHGITLTTEPSKEAGLNIKTKVINGDCVIAIAYEQGAAHQGGLSAGDVLVAIDNIRVDSKNLDTVLSRYRVKDKVTIHVFRRDELRSFKVKLHSKETKFLLKRR
ncbi:M61 family metallopeptidase [Pelistega europaea]|uniref:M61 family metallopeptidase n=1 Tax=Pelistega europaea TaxID=106147 RepID=A0A7Y4P4J5_9BURK|nr:PDZ domain-containing protein [Pelistega europaea]NOL48778.1 M61 family metallopeptidase [Pelistega europaea]